MIPETFNIKYFTTAMNSVSDGIAIINKSGKAVWVNQSFSDLVKLAKSDCLHIDFSVFVADSAPDKIPFFHSFGPPLRHHYIPLSESEDETGLGIVILINPTSGSYPDYRHIVAHLPIGIGFLKRVDNIAQDFEFVYVNQAGERLLNSQPDQLSGKKFSRQYPDLSGLLDVMIRGIDTPGSKQQTYLTQHNNHWIKFEAISYDKEHITLTLLDLTSQMDSFLHAGANPDLRLDTQQTAYSELQHQIEDLNTIIALRTQELELSNERFRLLTKATNDIAWDWNLTNNQLTFSEVFDAEFGSETYVAANGLEYWQSRLHPDDREKVITNLHKCIHNPQQQSWKAEYRLLSRHGHYEPILDRGYIIRDEQHHPVRMVGSMLKVSDVKIIESKLRTTEQMYQVLAESMPQLVYSVNAEGRGDYFNLRWLDYLGSLPKTMTEDMWSDIIFPDDLPVIRQEWDECSKTHRSMNVELRIRNKEGKYRWFLTRAIPILDENNRIIRWVGTSTDIHDQKTQLENLEKTEQQLNQDLSKLNFTTQHLAKLNKELDSFIHIASHDLRNPIKNMEFLLNMMQEELKPYLCDNDNLREIFSLVQKSNKVLKNLVIDLTEVSVNNEEDHEMPDLVDVEEIINDVLTSIGDLITENDPDLHIDLQIKKLHIRAKEIRSILFNLINNAIKYRSESRRPVIKVSFTYSPERDKLILKVEDNGIGIAQEDQSKVFVPFKRLHKASPGLGLGMSLVKQTIEKNGGAIEVCSEVDKGTIFTITLPASLV